MAYLIVIGLGALGFLVFSAIRIIPTAHFGVVTVLGKRTGRFLTEGFNLVFPFLTQVELVSEELESDPVSVSFTTSDRVSATVAGSIQWRPDKKVTARKEIRGIFGENRTVDNWITFVEMSEDAVKEGIKDAVGAVLGAIAGFYGADDFIARREELSDIVNAALQLEKPPHLFPDDFARTFGAAAADLKTDTGTPYVDASGRVAPHHCLDFYRQYKTRVKQLLANERTGAHEISEVERRYGIAIETFALAGVAFSPETKRALDRERQVIAFNAAVGELRKQSPNLTEQEAVNQIAAIFGSADKIVVSSEGIAGGAPPIIVIDKDNKRRA